MSYLTARILPVLLLSSLCACGGSGSSSAAPNPPVEPPPVPPSPIEPGLIGDGRLGELVERVRERHVLPALGAIVVANGVVVEQAVDGRRSITSTVPVTTDDRWHLGSVGKAMTATLAAILVEQSMLSWDTTPADVWPGDAATMHAAYRNITVVQLLSHQAGIQPDQGMIPSIALTADDAPGTRIEKRRLWAKELLELNPANAAGEFNYANGGYIVVGSMLETLTGQSWETLMTNNVFLPLGMLNTGFGAPGEPGELDQPWGHQVQAGQLTAIPPGPGADNRQAIGPAGTIHTTMNDYALFMFAHLEGELGVAGLVSADTFRFLHAPVGGHDYALGWRVDDGHAWAEGPLLFHLGTNLRWVANAGIVPGLNTGILIVTNAGDQAALDASDEMANLLLTRILESR
jgi:CubicO group peptidase (beta-lactamase class C family)